MARGPSDGNDQVEGAGPATTPWPAPGLRADSARDVGTADNHTSARTETLRPYGSGMTDAGSMPTHADARFVHDEWDRRTRAHDIDALLDLYLPDATLESPLVPRVLDQPGGVLRGHDELRRFFVRGTEGRPDDLVRWYRTGDFLFAGRTLMWEYPRQTPDGDQVDLVEVMALAGRRIAHHRIYWGWYGTPLLRPDR
jgi:hypothetical protein